MGSSSGPRGQSTAPRSHWLSARAPERPLRILVVNEDRQEGGKMAELLHQGSRWTVEVLEASDADVALAYATAEPVPDCVLLDGGLGSSTGFELIQWIRGEPRSAAIPVITLSHEMEHFQILQSMRSGANDYICKEGLTPEVLMHSIEGTLSRMQLEADLSTELRRRQVVEGKLREAKAKAEQATEAKSQFLSMMSHDIRTPMNGVLGMTELLSDTSLDANQRECVEVIYASASSLLNLLNDILDVSKIEAGKLELELMPLDLHEELEQLRRVFVASASGKGLAFRVETDIVPPFFVETDPTRLRQVLINLVGNAMKFTAHGEVTVVVSAEREGTQSEKLSFSVKDSGIGMSSEQLQRLFVPFVQADHSMTRKYGGTGLGLNICRKLCRAMGGEVEVQSKAGSGSMFTATIVARRIAKPVPVPMPTSSELVHGLQALAGRRILVADDNRVNRMVAERMLLSLGLEPVVVDNGQKAVAECQAGEVDLVFMDCQMPETDGYQATAQIRGLDGPVAALPIVALTASAAAEDRDRCTAAGMDGFLTKPLSRAGLQEALLKHLRRG